MESESRQRGSSKGSGTVYRIVVRDELSARFAAAFEGMEMKIKNGQTVLEGEVIDQPHLHGILDRINSLGLKLLNVEAMPQEPKDTTARPPRINDRVE